MRITPGVRDRSFVNDYEKEKKIKYKYILFSEVYLTYPSK